MPVSRFLKAFAVSFMLFTLLDGYWHGGVMAQFYAERLRMINPSNLTTVPNYSLFILFVEFINAVALSYIVLHCRPSGSALQDGAWLGALLGFTVTGTVNFLNHALVPWWDIQMVLVDTAWGTIAGMIVGFLIAFLCPAPVKPKGIFHFKKKAK